MADTKYNPFENTQKSWEELEGSLTDGWENPWDVDTGEFETWEEVDTESLKEAGKNTIATLAASGSVIVSDLFTLADDSAAITAVTDAAASASLNFLKKKIEDIKTAWNTPVEVTVKAVIDEISPYCAGDLAEVQIPKFVDVLQGLTNTLLGTNGDSWEDIFSDLGEQAIDYVTADENFLSSVADLAAIKTLADSLNTISNIIEAVKKILTILEPVRPILETVYLFAVAWATGGSSTALGTNSMEETVEVTIQRLISISLKTIRKYIYNIKFKVPSLLVNAYKSTGLSIKDYVNVSWKNLGISEKDSKWLDAFFSEKFYEDNLASPAWQKAISKLERKIANGNLLPNWAGTSDSRWERILSGTVSSVANAAVSRARQVSSVPDYNQVIWSDPTTWFDKSQEAWTRAANAMKWAELLREGEIGNYKELTSMEDNPIQDVQDVLDISGILLGSDLYASWLDDLAEDNKDQNEEG